MINKAIILGNIGADPEQHKTQSANALTTFSVATSQRWTGKDGQPQEQTEWHRIVTFGKLAEICGKYLSKGSKVYIEGRLRTNKWKDQDGNTRYTTEIVANEMKMLDHKPEDVPASTDKQITKGNDTPETTRVPFDEVIPF